MMATKERLDKEKTDALRKADALGGSVMSIDSLNDEQEEGQLVGAVPSACQTKRPSSRTSIERPSSRRGRGNAFDLSSDALRLRNKTCAPERKKDGGGERKKDGGGKRKRSRC